MRGPREQKEAGSLPLDAGRAGWSMTAMRIFSFPFSRIGDSFGLKDVLLRVCAGFLALGLGLGIAGLAAADSAKSALFLDKGQAAQEAGRLTEARGWYERAIVQNPASADAYAHLARAENELGDAPRARRHFAIALEIDPNNPPALYWSGLLDIQEGREDEARKKLDRLKKTCSTCPQRAALAKALETHGAGKAP